MGGIVEDLLWLALLQNVALGHKQHPVGYFPGKAHLVGNNDAGHAGFHQALDNIQHFTHHFGIQGGGRLIKEHHVRLHSQSPDDGQALLLPAGEIAGHLVIFIQQAYPVQQVLGHLVGLGLALALEHLGGQGDILSHRQVGDHIEVLEHHAHLLPVKIVLPQAVRNILPALGNEFIMMLKETSLASTFFLGDIMTSYLVVKGVSYLTLEPLTIVAIIYRCVTFPLSKLVEKFGKKMANPNSYGARKRNNLHTKGNI